MIQLNIIEVTFLYTMCKYMDIRKIINLEFEIHGFLIIMMLLIGYYIRMNLRIQRRNRIHRY